LDDLRDLISMESKVKEAMDVYCAHLWAGSVPPASPAAAPTFVGYAITIDEVLWCTYTQWVWGSASFCTLFEVNV